MSTTDASDKAHIAELEDLIRLLKARNARWLRVVRHFWASRDAALRQLDAVQAECVMLQRDADDAHMTAAQHAEEVAKASEAIRGLAKQASDAEAQVAKLRDTIREGLAANAMAERDLKPEEWWLYAQKDDQGIDLEGDFFVVLGPWNGKELPVRFPDLGNGFGLRRNLTEDELRKHAPDALARASVHKTHQQEAARHAARAGA